MTIGSLLETLEASAAGTWVRESTWGFAIVVGGHILGLALSVGVLAWFDLRLLGVGVTGVPVSRVFRRLMPWAFGGFALMFATGLLLFAAYATDAYPNPWFRLKLIAMTAAGGNALAYHLITERTLARWDRAATPPPAARLAGGLSLGLWASVVLLGRAMAYTMF